jgi:hypothetical protein
VSLGNVVVHIYKLRSFSCDQYKVFFNPWGKGGANFGMLNCIAMNERNMINGSKLAIEVLL